MGVSSALSTSGVAGAEAPPPASLHSCSCRELSQRFSWFCLKLLSPPGTRTRRVE